MVYKWSRRHCFVSLWTNLCNNDQKFSDVFRLSTKVDRWLVSALCNSTTAVRNKIGLHEPFLQHFETFSSRNSKGNTKFSETNLLPSKNKVLSFMGDSYIQYPNRWRHSLTITKTRIYYSNGLIFTVNHILVRLREGN